MAKLIKKRDENYPDNNGVSFKSVAAWIMILSSVAFGLYGVFGSGKAALLPALLLFIAGILILVSSYGGKSAAEMAGIEGEEFTGGLLSRYLPEDYCVIQNKRVTYGNNTSEIDNIVIGPTGVFIIETKNAKGLFIGDSESKNWRRIKTDNYGNRFESEVYSPVKQVGTHTYRLANYLRDNKIFVTVTPMVYFANKNAQVRFSGDGKIPVYTFDATRDMISRILSGGEIIDKKTAEKIVNILNN